MISISTTIFGKFRFGPTGLVALFFLIVLTALLTTAAAEARLVLLEANFDARTPGESLGREGALAGEPVPGPDDFESETIHEDSPGDNSVQLADDESFGSNNLYWVFREDREITDGKLHISCELEFTSHDSYHLYLPQNVWLPINFVHMVFDAAGDFYLTDADTPVPQLGGTYSTSTVHEVVMEFDLDLGVYDLYWDGNPVVTDQSHGVVNQGITTLVVGHPSDLNTTGLLRFDNPSVSWLPGNAEEVLHANFNNEPLGQPIGFGGAELGQPVSATGTTPTVEVGPPLGNPALVIPDESTFGPAVTTFEFLGSTEIATPLSISFQFAVDQLDSYLIQIREQGGTDHNFLTIRTNSSGQVFFTDADDSGSPNTVHTYSAQTPTRVEIHFEPSFGIYDIWWAGERIIYREEFGVSFPDFGSVIIGGAHDTDQDGTIYLDALKVHTLADVVVTAVPTAAPVADTLQAAPNPFNPATEIQFELARPGQVRLDIYDSRGRLIGRLVDGSLPTGRHRTTWQGLDSTGRRLASGVYHALLTVDGQPTQRTSLTMVK